MNPNDLRDERDRAAAQRAESASSIRDFRPSVVRSKRDIREEDAAIRQTASDERIDAEYNGLIQ